MSRLKQIGDWLDERAGWRALLDHALNEPIPGGARWAYVFGSALLFVLVLQAVTGILLASHYAPSSASAWASVAYVQQQVTLGWVIRGLHSNGASAMMILVALHILQTAVWGAYRKPRELNWWLGVALMGVIFGFALTGYLLPWDQKGYWATQVATSLMGASPVIGDALKVIVQGGPEYGNLTLTHFYALHVLLLPAVALLLVGAHVGLFRRHGVTSSWSASDADLKARTEMFYPGQVFRDMAAAGVVLALMLAAVIMTHGASLEAPADPASSYDARPEWYFLPLYQLLKYFPGKLEMVAALGAPVVVGGALVLLPFLDRSPARAPSARKLPIAIVLSILFGAVFLASAAKISDAHNAAFQRGRERAEREAERALHLALAGVPSTSATAVLENDPLARGRRLFRDRCAGCHMLEGQGEERAPHLDRWSSRAWLHEFLHEPDAPRFYGRTKVHGMKPVKVTGAELDALVEWIYSQGGSTAADKVDAAKVSQGEAIFKRESCDDCHSTSGSGDGDGVPDLGGRASADWIRAFLLDPAGGRFFDGKNDMPSVRNKLNDEEIDALVGLLRAERAK